MTRIMGVLNVTPDSFSDGGEFLDPELAVARAREMVSQGADIIDVGGESTGPGSERIDPQVEQARIMPIVRALCEEGMTVSVDTLHASTAAVAIAAGVSVINDVSGGTHDPEILSVVAESATPSGAAVTLILGHWRGTPDPNHTRSVYDDVVRDVREDLARQLDAARAAGIRDEQLVIDPGLGFDKTADQGWQILANLREFAHLQVPVMVGVSRKRMLGDLLATVDANATVADRDLPTAVVSAYAADAGVWAVRVHDVASTRVALAVQQALQEARS